TRTGGPGYLRDPARSPRPPRPSPGALPDPSTETERTRTTTRSCALRFAPDRHDNTPVASAAGPGAGTGEPGAGAGRLKFSATRIMAAMTAAVTRTVVRSPPE